MRRSLGAAVRVVLAAGLLAPSAGVPVVWSLPAEPAVLSIDAADLQAVFLQLLNTERIRAGLPVTVVDGAMAAMAQDHAQAQAAQERIFHNPAKVGLLGRCMRVGENVGRGSTVDLVHQALMQSAVHRSEILGPYDLVGVGVAAGETMLYVTELFCQSRPDGAPPAPSPKPTVPAPAPRPVVKKIPSPKPAAPKRPPAEGPPPPAPSVTSTGMGSPRTLL